jgi:SprB repeat/Fibronectin type III domain/Putative metal-binding motif/Secretion system C-terminal sorting domain
MISRFYKLLGPGLVSALMFLGLAAQAQVTVSGGTAAAGSYTSLDLALTAVNANAATGAIAITFTAGYTETAPVKGLHIGSATLNPTLNATNTLTITGPVTLNAGVGTSATSTNGEHDGIIKVVGADYVTLDGLTLVDPNASTSGSAMADFGIAFYKMSATDGSRYCTVRNCSITLNHTNNASAGGARAEGSIGILVVNADRLTPNTASVITDASGAHSFNKFYTNTISKCNYGILASGQPSTPTVLPLPATFIGDQGNDFGGASAATGNMISNFGAAGGTNPAAGIRLLHQYNVNASYNTINNNTGTGSGHTTTMRGIYNQTGPNASFSVNNNTVTLTPGITTSTVTAIENASGTKSVLTYNNKGTMIGNSITATLTGTGVFYGIYNLGGSPDTLLINNNVVNNITTTTGTVYLLFQSINTTFYPRYAQANNNQLTNAVRTGGTLYGLYFSSIGLTQQAINNTIQNITSTPTGTNFTSTYGFYSFGSTPAHTFLINSNKINNLKILGSGTYQYHTIYGMYASTTTLINTRTMDNNTISNLGIMAGSGTLYGLFSGSGYTLSISKNKIFNLTNVGIGDAAFVTVPPVVHGLYSTTTGSLANVTIANNMIAGLRTPASNTTNITALVGLRVTQSTGNCYLNHNTVFLNATSTGADFSPIAAAIGPFTASTPMNYVVQNNAFVNTSIPKGTGSSVALLKFTTLAATAYSSLSNNNLYYVSAAPLANRYLYYESSNTTFLAPTANVFNTIGALKSGNAPRDANSILESPTFISTSGTSPSFLHINLTVPTFMESGGVAVAATNSDIDGDVRNATTPDIGADEFAGTLVAACVGTPAGGTTSIGAVTYCNGGTTQLLNNAVNIATQISFQWVMASDPAGPFTNVVGGSGATTQSYVTPNNLSVGTYYYALNITCVASGLTTMSNVIQLIVKPVPTATATSNAPICKGANLTLTGTSDIGATFNWSGPAAFASTSSSAGVTNAQYTNSGLYAFSATLNGCTSPVYSLPALVTYAPEAPAITPAGDIAVCAGGGAVTINAAGVNPASSITTGVGTATNVYTAYPTPYGAWYGSTRTQYLITSAELTAMGMVPGSALTSVSTSGVASASTAPGAHLNFTISIGTTSASSLAIANGWANTNTLVYGPTSYTPNNNTTPNYHAFTNYFIWDGASNIVVQFCHVNGTPSSSGSTSTSYSANASINYTATTNNSVMWRNNDGADNCNSGSINAPSGVSPNRANMTFSVAAPSVSYNWTPGGTLNQTTGTSVIATPSATTTYTVTALTTVGCSASNSKTVSILTPITIAGSSTPVTCVGFTNGTATAVAAGGSGMGYSYVWDNGQTTATATGLSAGSYVVYVSDSNGCSNSASVTVGANAAVVATAVVDNHVSCFGGSDAAVTVTGTGGQTPYTGAGTFTGVNAGPKSYTMVDANGCQSTAMVTVTQPDLLVVTGAATAALCNGNANGSIDATVTGGTAAYSYAWSNSAMTEDLTGLTAGAYDVVVTDSKSCVASTSVVVSQPAVLTAATSSQVNVLCNGAATGALATTVAGGVMPYTYVWSNGGTAATTADLVAGAYSVVVTDANACTAMAATEITQPAALVLAYTSSAPTCFSGAYVGTMDGTVTVTATGGVEAYTGAGLYTDLAAGAHSYTVTDANGCVATIETMVAQGAANATYYANADGDGFGNPLSTILSCTGLPAGYLVNNTDCDDTNAATYPNAQEYANGIDDDCNGSIDDVCLAPGNFTEVLLSPTSVMISWTASINLKKYIVRYRAVGTTTWFQIATALATPTTPSPNNVTISGLSASTAYEYQVRTHCNSGFTAWAPLDNFSTPALVCPVPTGLAATNIAGTSAKMMWTAQGAYTTYHVRYRLVGTTAYTNKTGAITSWTATGLAPGATYEYSVRTSCGGTLGFSAFSATSTFTTVAALQQYEASITPVVYPNPTSNLVFIKDLQEDVISVSITNQLGMQIMDLDRDAATFGVDVIELNDGMYYFVIERANGDRQTLPFMKSSR